MINIINVSFFYDHTHHVIKNFNLDIQQGEFIVITGKSGCGKTTLMKIINGLIPRYYSGEVEGDIIINGKNLNYFKPGETGKYISNVFQNPESQFISDIVEDEVALAGENLGIPHHDLVKKVNKSCELLNITGLMKKKISCLSSGQKQKVALASSLINECPIILLDEPTANLDMKSSFELSELLNKLRKLGKTIVVCEHRLVFFKKHLDRLVIMDDGEIKKIVPRQEIEKIDTIALGLRPLSYNINKNVYTSSISNHLKKSILCRDLMVSNSNIILMDNINININNNTVVAILGENGIGKTTFSKQMCGLFNIKHGFAVTGETKKQRLNSSYYMMQDVDSQLFFDTVEKELLIGNQTDEKLNDAQNILKYLDLWSMRTKLPQMRSVGEKQRICVGVACMSDCPYIFLDEPTSGLDYERMIRVSELIKEKSKKSTILVVTHDYDFIIECCQDVIIMTADGANIIPVKGNKSSIYQLMLGSFSTEK
ncbi:hypothetical protein CE665_24860 [Salmonella enterica subsp. enterica serovar Poona]|nr:ABC transporter ATP-binding protein [Salmonella enterica]EDJ2557546.1 hypothetical protein [Salmonella enterica subsp. enterica serovar Poona]